MAHEKIDLPGHTERHRQYHIFHHTICNHDCRYYEDLREEQLQLTIRFLEQNARLRSEPSNFGITGDQYVDKLRKMVFDDESA